MHETMDVPSPYGRTANQQSRDPARAIFRDLIHEGMRLQEIDSESAFARRYDFSPSSLSQWMGEHRNGKLAHVSQDNLSRLSTALGVSLQQVLYALAPTAHGATSPLPVLLEWATTSAAVTPPRESPGGHLWCAQPIPLRYGRIWRAFHLLGDGLKRHAPPIAAGTQVLVRCGPLIPQTLGLVRLPSGERLCGAVHPRGYLHWWEEEDGRRIPLQDVQMIGTVVQLHSDLS